MTVHSLEEMVIAVKAAQATREEYGKYRAKRPIDHGGARAYNVGDQVPQANVIKHGYLDDDLVEEVPADDPVALAADSGAEGVALDVDTHDAVRPKRNASRDAWLKYALSQQVDGARLGPMNRDQIADLFGPDPDATNEEGAS